MYDRLFARLAGKQDFCELRVILEWKEHRHISRRHLFDIFGIAFNTP
jgi:hypothetical protein